MTTISTASAALLEKTQIANQQMEKATELTQLYESYKQFGQSLKLWAEHTNCTKRQSPTQTQEEFKSLLAAIEKVSRIGVWLCREMTTAIQSTQTALVKGRTVLQHGLSPETDNPEEEKLHKLAELIATLKIENEKNTLPKSVIALNLQIHYNLLGDKEFLTQLQKTDPAQWNYLEKIVHSMKTCKKKMQQQKPYLAHEYPILQTKGAESSATTGAASQ